MSAKAWLACLALACASIASAEAPSSDADLRRQLEELRQRVAELEKGPRSLPRPARAAAQAPSAAPFGFADFTWLNGNSRVKDPLVDNEYFTGQFMVDASYLYDFNRPKDHTLVGGSQMGRTNEFQVQHLGIGGDLHVGNVRGRVITQFGMYSQIVPRNDASPGRGQYGLDNAYRYLSEAYGGYHWDKLGGINVDAGMFTSYVGLFSAYLNENWAYMPSYVSANTPWYFNGVRAQFFPTEHLKIEPWLINGWQSYGMYNDDPGVGGQVLWRPTGSLSILSNNYWGHDTLGNARRQRWHTDNSVQVKYWDSPGRLVDKAAFSVTLDAGCEEGGGVGCFGGGGRPKQAFLGYMVYDRTWFHRDLFAVTLGGGQITNPGRYLVLLPPINGATAVSGTPYFTTNPGDGFKAWDTSITFDYMPSQYLTWRTEYNHRQANVPYFAGRGGVTPAGGNSGAAGSAVAGFTPDLRRAENRITLALLIRL